MDDTKLVLDPELTKISIAYLEELDKLHRCPDCGKMRYLSNMYYCANPDCTYDDPKD